MSTTRTDRVSLTPLTSYNSRAVDSALAELIAPLGGIDGFVGSAAEVVLKPNFLSPATPDRATCTHPEILRGVARLVRSSTGASRVIATDSPGVGTAKRCAKKLGLGENEPFAVENIDDGVEVSGDQAEKFHHLMLSQVLRDAQVLINLPKAKTHAQMVITAAVKNTFGAVIGYEKAQWHFRTGRDPLAFARLIVQIHELVKPKLNILDAVIGMEGNGPGSGTPRPAGFLAASTNAYALDAVLCQIWGIHPQNVFTLAVAQELGLLPPLQQIEIVGAPIETFKPHPPWELARPMPLRNMGTPNWMIPLLDRVMSLRPQIQKEKCNTCGQCAKSCAAQAITMPDASSKTGDDKVPLIDTKTKCISCFCCQEVCPEGAITVRAGLAARLFGLGRTRN